MARLPDWLWVLEVAKTTPSKRASMTREPLAGLASDFNSSMCHALSFTAEEAEPIRVPVLVPANNSSVPELVRIIDARIEPPSVWLPVSAMIVLLALGAVTTKRYALKKNGPLPDEDRYLYTTPLALPEARELICAA